MKRPRGRPRHADLLTPAEWRTVHAVQHGMTNVGYWVNTIGGRSDELWYILAYEDLAARETAWAAFKADPEWQRVAAESEADGAIVHHIENRMLTPTDFSPLA